MQKKRIVFIYYIIILAIGLAAGGFMVWKYMSGLKPVLLPPSENIADIIEQQTQEEPADNGEADNRSGFPLVLPDGFSISIYAKGLGKPRVMQYAPGGRMVVSVPAEGKVVALKDNDFDGVIDEYDDVITGLNDPHGLAFRCRDDKCKMYIAETDQVAIYDYDEINAKAFNKQKIIDLPSGGGHYTRTIMFGADEHADDLFISAGSSCNACVENDWRRASIMISNYDGSGLRTFASGLRNSVFMAIHPVNGEIWATEMGRDMLGDDLPPEEINIIEDGGNYGWPYCYGEQVHDDSFDPGREKDCSHTIPPHIAFQAHSAPLGLAFFPEEGWPEDYWYNLLVAYHGSWNRSEPTGYKIVRFKLDAQGNYLGQENFITGWLTKDNEALGRPVDILIQPGGTIYISDDKAGVIYKVVKK